MGKSQNINKGLQTAVIVFAVLAILFLVVSILIGEFGGKTKTNGDVVLPWYYYLFFSLSFLCFFICICLLIFTIPKEPKFQESQIEQSQMEQFQTVLSPQIDTTLNSPVIEITRSSTSTKTYPVEPSMSFDSLRRN